MNIGSKYKVWRPGTDATPEFERKAGGRFVSKRRKQKKENTMANLEQMLHGLRRGDVIHEAATDKRKLLKAAVAALKSVGAKVGHAEANYMGVHINFVPSGGLSKKNVQRVGFAALKKLGADPYKVGWSKHKRSGSGGEGGVAWEVDDVLGANWVYVDYSDGGDYGKPMASLDFDI